MLKKATLKVVNPKALPSCKEVKKDEQVLIQYRNGYFGIGVIGTQRTFSGNHMVERLILFYRQGRAGIVRVLPDQG